jgi:hypothetical protein|tara:strand:+ start:425 stop:616 length:192 start_codon:yes stop_codon:yes gene_type:complete
MDDFELAKWKEINLTRKKFIILLVAVLILFIGLLLGYKLGINASEGYFLPKIAALKNKCIILY